MRRLITIAFLFATSQAWAAFGYYSPISVNSAQVPSTQTDFPVLVNVTDTRFKSVANGGHCQTNFDVRPYTDTTLTTAITGYELERYNASTGEVVMWVKVPSLTSSSTPFVLAYGNASLTTDGSSTTTWSNSFIGVFHLKDGTTLSVTDSTGGAIGTNSGATATTGQIDGGAGMVRASSQQVQLGSSRNPAATTLSIWAKATSLPATMDILTRNDGSHFSIINVRSDGKLQAGVAATGNVTYDGTGSHTLSTATWYYLTLTYDSTSGLVVYVNAASDKTVAANGAINTSAASMAIGNDPFAAGRFFDGVTDEGRVASVARSQDWITTEYNNQSAPGTFMTLETEVEVTTGANGWFYFFP